ncbi:CPBP family intramembrane metalloprotease [Luteolibacter sp. SL250]|uniref:CPBP family intramembrane glutamic endopeptidase n=1 Tax=Luteolibacter sp. SL250 TaxID=2995170 RepID=UPI002271B8A8|nr:CPBP family intramembrane glutamic endopeptidase [Luteolibacter sp. SL250]WAC19687.1 CPBP family intramembrane metalloprotease [Luteolibacter sp. SL250]
MRFLKSEAGAVVVWLIGTIVLAAGLFPWIYAAGQALAAHAAGRELAPIWESIGRSAERADLGTYFSRSLYAAVLLLLPWLIIRMRRIRNQSRAAAPPDAPQRMPWKTRLVHLASAIVLAAGMLWLLGGALRMAGAFAADPDPASLSRIISKALAPAFFAAVIEEWLFRGLLLGIWLRILRPRRALLTVSFIFAFVHFLAPPDGSDIADPAAPLAGFRMLGLIFGHFLDPRFIAAEFLALFTVGLILGATRLRTGSLWFPIGLHAGWIFAFKSFNMVHIELESPLRPLWIGDSLRSGLLPLATLLVTAMICHFTLRRTKGGDDGPRNRQTI